LNAQLACALRTVEERNGRIDFLENQLVESQRRCQEELAHSQESYQGSLDKREQKIHSLQNQLDESSQASVAEEAKNLIKFRAHADEIQSLQDELSKQKANHVSEVDRIEARHKETLVRLDEDRIRELEGRERNVGLQIQRNVNGFLVVLGKKFLEFEAALGAISDKVTQLQLRHVSLSAKLKNCKKDCTILRTTIQDKDSAIEVLRLRLEEATRRENDVRKEKSGLSTKWLSMRDEGEERERELKDANKCIEALRKELKVFHTSTRQRLITLVDDCEFNARYLREAETGGGSRLRREDNFRADGTRSRVRVESSNARGTSGNDGE